MSHFTEAEIAYLQSQPLGRLATNNATGEPHVVPVSFRYNAELDTIDIGGHNMAKSKKYRDIVAHPQVAFVIDDVLPPWKPRGVEVRGRATQVTVGGKNNNGDFDDELIRITPTQIVGWGIDTDAFHPSSRKIS